ncbi:hypothetical protein BS50DRAFT_577596 [Corynespora cassiicola Philippines]|uniref:Uncharacterized protein n=1 Tax=Corynespora cassiicola Philippines TaxID=1448308 RepID=A0A2T2NBR2_CORCC|nr:hypothetical protein BS50DRAFT_577596 [Corynespora cassiicola Philippines]
MGSSLFCGETLYPRPFHALEYSVPPSLREAAPHAFGIALSWPVVARLGFPMRQTMRERPPGMRPGNTPPLSPIDYSSHHKPSYESQSQLAQRASRDMEKQDADPSRRPSVRRSSWADKEDPFGDEEGAEVKYRTLRWW